MRKQLTNETYYYGTQQIRAKAPYELAKKFSFGSFSIGRLLDGTLSQKKGKTIYRGITSFI